MVSVYRKQSVLAVSTILFLWQYLQCFFFFFQDPPHPPTHNALCFFSAKVFIDWLFPVRNVLQVSSDPWLLVYV